MRNPVTRRSFLIDGGKAILGAGLTGAVLAGCGREGGSSDGNLTIWSDISGAELRRFYSNNSVKPFEKDNPGIDLEVSFVDPGEMDRIVRTALQGGQGKDLVPTPGPSFALEYVQADLFMDLNEYAQQYGWQDKMLGWAYEAGKFEDKLYSTPLTYETLPLYYNKTLFEEKGWQPPANREEFEALAREAQGQGIIPVSAGSADWKPTTEWFSTIFWNHYSGPDAVYQALTGEIPWTDPIFVEAIDIYRRYFQEGWFGGGVQKFFATGNDEVYAQFGDGKAAMNMNGSWFLYDINNYFGQAAGNENEWDWLPITPFRDEVPASIFSLSTGTTLSINARSENPDGAAKYIDWLFSHPEVQAKEIAEIQRSGVPVPLEKGDFPSDMDSRARDMMLSLNNASSEGNFGFTTWTFWPPKSDVFVYEGMEKVLTDDITPAEYCAELNKIFKEEREEGLVPPTPKPKVA